MSIQWDDESSPNVVWDNVQWDEPEQKSYAKRVLTESAPAVLNLIPDAINAGVAGLMGAGDAVGGMVRGKGIGPSLESGAETFERGMESMREPGRPGIPRFKGKGVEESEQSLMGLIEKGVGYVGDITEDPLPFAQTQTPTEWLSPAGRTIGEAATNFIPVERAVKGFKGSQAAKQGLRDAQNILERKQAGEAEYSSWEDEAAKNNEYYAATIEMDTLFKELDANGQVMTKKSGRDKGEPVTRSGMVRYPDDYQGPQFGLGGKMARNPDQVGNRTRGDYTNQLKYDEDIAQTARDSQAWEFEQAETARRNKVLEVPNPMLDQGRRPVEGKTNIIGPSARLKAEFTDADQVAMETRARMAERDRPAEPAWESPDSQAIADEVSAAMNRGRNPVNLDRQGNLINFPYMEGGTTKFPVDFTKMAITTEGQLKGAQVRKEATERDLNELRSHLESARSSGNLTDQRRTLEYINSTQKRLDEINKSIESYQNTLNKPRADVHSINTDRVDSEINKHLDSYLNKDNGQRGRGDVQYDRDGNPIDFPYKEGGYAFTDFKRELAERGVKVSDAAAKAMYDASALAEKPKAPPAHPKGDAVQFSAKVPGLERIKREYKDDRTWDEMLPAAQASKDVGMVHKNVTAKIVGGKYTAGDHPLWSWISSQIHSIKHKSMQSAADMLHGKSRKNPDPGTYNYTWRQLTGKEREAVNDFAWKHNNSDKPVTSSDLATLSPKQRQAYQDRVAINKKVLADVNKKLVEEGKQPIPELPNYWSPIIVDDPFVVKFKDAAGETKKIAGFYRKPDVKALEKIAAEHGMTAELMPEKGLRGELDFEQIEWVLRQLSKEQRDPAAKGLSEGLRRQGFMKHGLKRKGVEGGEGSMGGRRGLREYEETSEKYIRRAYEWISNRELDALYKKVLDETTLDNQPYAKAFALEALDTARGGANKSFEGFSKAVGDIVSGTIQVGTLGKLRLPNRFARDLLRHSNKVKTTLLLGFGNVTNIAANILQAPSYGVPAMMAVAAKAGANIGQMAVAVPKALAKTSAEMLKWDDSSDIKKLRELGALDATFKYDWSTYASDMDPRYRNTAVEHLTGISTLSYIESNAVRRPASLMFLNILREIGYDKIAKTPDEIYYVAKEMTDKYMVSTRWYEKPHMFSRSGIVGTATSPLQSFTTTWLGMLKEYAQLSKEGLLQPSIAKQAPLVTFLAMNVMTAGLLGLIGVKEWDALATFANKHFGMNIPTGTEWIMSKWKNNKVRFGLLSDAVGVHIGATFNAPTLTGSFAPGMQMIGDVANFGYQAGRQYGNELGMGNDAPTAVEKREAKKGVMPRFNWLDRAGEAAGLGSTGMNWGDIEQKATPRGAPYQDMAGNAGPITRDDADWTARKFGTYTTKEATAKTENYLAQRTADERSQRLSKIIGRAADILVMNPDDPNVMAKIEPIIAKAEADNFKGTEIRDALKREILTKYIESDTRAIGKGKTSRQAYIYKLLESLR